MIFDLDDLLDMVDGWKFKLHEKLKSMTSEERAAFWKETRNKVLAGRVVRGRGRKPSARTASRR